MSNGAITLKKNIVFNSKKELLMQSLIKYFSNDSHLGELIPIITGKSKTSLRLIDWFVTNYSKKHGTAYEIKVHSEKKHIIVYLHYRSQLKAYSKKQFDTFCRGERISIIDKDQNEYITTVGQLNFFKWAIEYKILDYINENFKAIENDMTVSLKNVYKKKKDGEKRRKRQELSISATRSIKIYDTSIVVKFD